MLINGQWTSDWHPYQADDGQGGFVRQSSSFRGGVAAEAGRYHLYAALICPWASRALVARRLKGLDDVVSLSILAPEMTAQGWQFSVERGGTQDDVNGADYLHQIYTKADPAFTGRATVPVLWDKAQGTIVNNESADILRLFNSGFGRLASSEIDLYPRDLQPAIDALNEDLYRRLNNGVYRAGFARSQKAYESAVRDVFAMLDLLDHRLGDGGPYLFGDRLTETDIRLFVTLVRFDAAYHGLFKCNLRRVADYRHLSRYLARLLSRPAFGETVSIDHIKRGYYSLSALNPSGVVPIGPAESLPPVEGDHYV